MKIGYSYWGFLGDRKYNEKFELLSTPDGNAFYSWCIIRKIINEGNKVIRIMPDRDRYGWNKEGRELFGSWCTDEREFAYLHSNSIEYDENNLYRMKKEDVFKVWDASKVNECKVVLHEWRMKINGRNDDESRNELREKWQPDLFLQECLVEYCSMNKIKLVIFDLDYKLEEEEFGRIRSKTEAYVFELGTKWKDSRFKEFCRKVYIPFDFSLIECFNIKLNGVFENDLVYVGNRYERDWCIDKYIPEDVERIKIYGNWKESGRDSERRWPKLKFGKRLQTADMRDVYMNSASTILLAKEEYCKYKFMTARIIEAIFYGCVPLFIKEYGKDVINEYAGGIRSLVTVKDKDDVKFKMRLMNENRFLRFGIIIYLRRRLKFMDVSNFTKELYEVCRGE